VSVMNALVQSLVWATLAGFLYVLWINKHETSPMRVFEQTRHLRRVTTTLQTLWIVIGLGLILSVFLLSLPPLARAAGTATPPCATSTSSHATASPYAYRSLYALCSPTTAAPFETYPARQDSGKGSVVPHPAQSAS